MIRTATLAILVLAPVAAAVPDRPNPFLPSKTGAMLTRNLVNLRERNLPADWCVEEGKFKNVKWCARVGTRTFGTPVVAHGRVFVATNNKKPRDASVKGAETAVLMAFAERDGAFLWQITHPCPKVPTYCPGDMGLLLSTPTVDERRLYYVTPVGEVICADAIDGAIRWRHDLGPKLKHVSINRCVCSPLVVGDLVFVNTGHGVGAENEEPPHKDAPSFVALNKKTGKLVWESSLPSANVIRGQWSNPTYADVDGRPQVIFAGGDGVIYSFAPENGKLLWKCDCLPQRRPRDDRQLDNAFAGTPVVVGNRLYVGMGLPHDGANTGPNVSYFLCLDIRRRADVSLKSYDAKAQENRGSALIWAFGGPIVPRPAKGRPTYFGPTMSTAAIHDGLVYISEHHGYLHCMDADTGRRYWEHDLRAEVIGSPYWVNGRIHVAGEDGLVWVLEHGKARKVVAEIDMQATMWTTPAAANGAIFVATHDKLYAISQRAQ